MVIQRPGVDAYVDPKTVKTPFAVALAQCAKLSPPTSGDVLDALCVPPQASSSSNSTGNKRRPTIADWIGLVRLYASCKTSCSVSETTVVVSRSTLRTAGPYGLLNHQTD
ncbi:hypothetical protein HPP92_009070 [Vanilla planifolia]|uniref:Uncharacterized protein n=1 Tax=Vanilla planifolia TaxID=51239 RepID=A0A835RF61_VANPL|nr:hypothetical protein HPP92_009070 [Vanilla planifolia]